MKSHPHIDLVDGYAKAAQKASLSHAEKATMKDALRENMKLSPVHRPLRSSPMPSAYFPYTWAILQGKKRFVAPIMLLLIVGGSTSYAAEGTVPGDLLYPVKINVNESVFSALSFSAVSKAKWAVEKVGRRLAEAKSASVNAAVKRELDSEAISDSQDADAQIAALNAQDPTDAQALTAELGVLLQGVSTSTSTVVATSTSSTSVSTPVLHIKKAAAPIINEVISAVPDADATATASDTTDTDANAAVDAGVAVTPTTTTATVKIFNSSPANTSNTSNTSSGNSSAGASVSASVSAPAVSAAAAVSVPAVSVPVPAVNVTVPTL